MIKLEGIHFISHAFIQSCELTLVRISCLSHAEKKPNGEGNNKSIKTKIFQNYLLAYGVKIRCLGPPWNCFKRIRKIELSSFKTWHGSLNDLLLLTLGDLSMFPLTSMSSSSCHLLYLYLDEGNWWKEKTNTLKSN